MCELLGMSFNKPVKCGFSFRGLIGRSKDNPSGWGIALYPEGGKAVQVIKEPLEARLSKLAKFVEDYNFSSNIFLSHIRMASSGTKSYANTHPFVRELNGREYTFAHNGTLDNDYRKELSTGRWKSVGDTDSEFSFCHLLNMMEDICFMWNSESFAELERLMNNINQYGKFNCLFTDGEYLFCYHDMNGYKGLWYTERKPPYYNNVRLKDEDMEINFQETKRQDEKGVVVATRPLTDEFWCDICPGTLMVFREGEQIFPMSEKDLDEKTLHALYTIRTSPQRISVFVIAGTVGVELNEVHKVLQPLINRKLIKQDSRDSGGPFDSQSTYYTIRSKRNEVNRLLQKAQKKSKF